MRRNFNLPSLRDSGMSRITLTLIGTASGLLLLNLVALYFYVAPPGGTRRELRAQNEYLRTQIFVAGRTAARVQDVAAKVQSGSVEASDFAKTYFMPKRLAYDAVLGEMQRMARESGLQSREAVFTEEAVEGSADLSVMNITGNFEGSYENLMKFLYQVDQSPMLLMLDTLQAAPQQHGSEVNTSIRFQTIIRDDEASSGAVQQ